MAKVKSPNPARQDPTRTKMLRQRFLAEVNKRFMRVKGIIRRVVEEQDSFGLGAKYTKNEYWQFRTSENQLSAFRAHLRTVLPAEVLGGSGDDWMREYILQGFQRGLLRSYDDMHRSDWATTHPERYAGTREGFLRSSFATPIAQERVEVLVSRVFTDLEGVTDSMASTMTRALADGLTQGLSPREVARMINREVDVGRNRARTIARTETIRAHAEGQLTSLEAQGLDEVGVMVEWSTSGLGITALGNPSPCPKCAPMKGVIFKIEEAHGMIPRHPNCMCSFIPAGVGEDTSGQKTGEERRQAVAESVAGEKEPRWAGAELAKPGEEVTPPPAPEAPATAAEVWAQAASRRREGDNLGQHIARQTELEDIRREMAKVPTLAQRREQIQKDWDAVNDQAAAIDRKYNDQIDALPEGPQGPPRRRLLLDQWDREVSKLDPIRNEIQERNSRIRRDYVSDISATFDRIAVSPEMRMEFKSVEQEMEISFNFDHGKAKTIDAPFSEEYRIKEREALARLSQLTVDQEAARRVDFYRLQDEDRAFQTNGVGVFLSDSHDKATFIHELGHHLEHQLPRLEQLAMEFRDYRIAQAGTPDVKLDELFPTDNFGESETGNRDDFVEAFEGRGPHYPYYAGKKYQGNSTEIISMGVEMIERDPVGFAQRDPEYFKFVIGALRGLL